MQRSVKLLVFNAIIAALYASLTAFLPALTYGPVQFRFGEALTILPMLILYMIFQRQFTESIERSGIVG